MSTFAVAYYRMSTTEQEASISEQQGWAAKRAKSEGIEIVREFSDPGIPGSEIDRRPGLMALVAFCEAEALAGRPIEAVVCWGADRFSRADSIRTAAVLSRLMDAGTSRMLTVDGWIDWENDLDRVLLNLKQDLTRAGESKSKSRDVTRSGIARAKQGLWVCGKPPYGYAVDADGRLTLADERRVEAVRWMFRHFASSADSLGVMAQKLTQSGAPAPRGGPWKRYAVRDILLNRAYLGELRWNSKRRGKYHRGSNGEVTAVRSGAKRTRAPVRNAPEDVIVVPNAHPALADADTFEACAAKMKAGRWKRTTPKTGGGEWVLTGLLHCGDCGGRMVGHTDRNTQKGKLYTYRVYSCHARVRTGPGSCRCKRVLQDVALKETAAEIRERLTNPTARAELLAEVELLSGQQAEETQAQRQALADRIAELDKQIDQGNENLSRLPSDLLPGVIAKVRQRQEERGQTARELARLDAVAEAGAAYAERVRGALEQLCLLEGRITEADPAAARDAIAGLVTKITLHFAHEPFPGSKKQRIRNRLSHLDIDLKPEIASLLGTGKSIRSAIRRSRRSIS